MLLNVETFRPKMTSELNSLIKVFKEAALKSQIALFFRYNLNMKNEFNFKDIN